MYLIYWIIRLGLPVLLSCSILITGAVPTSNPILAQANVLDNARARQGQSPVAAETLNNFGIKFVPLFSLIASFIPKLLRRFGNFTKTTSSKSEARQGSGIEALQMDGFDCSPGHFGAWKDPKDCTQFYVCKENVDASPECDLSGGIRQRNVVTGRSEQLEVLGRGCLLIERRKCLHGYVFGDEKKQCQLSRS